MCGRFTLKSNLADWIGSLFDTTIDNVPSTILASYNIAPTQPIWTIAHRSVELPLRCEKMLWGLLPQWVKTRGEGAKLINARSETILEKPTFRKIIQTNRCLVPADGYYEWRKLENGKKQPYWISRADEQPFVFAAIWQSNRFLSQDPEKPLLSTSIVTTHANDEFRELHDRMPLMLFTHSQVDRWMNDQPFSEHEMEAFARPPASGELNAIPVASKVGNVQQQGPELIESVALESNE